jgi:hypothetical protein
LNFYLLHLQNIIVWSTSVYAAPCEEDDLGPHVSETSQDINKAIIQCIFMYVREEERSTVQKARLDSDLALRTYIVVRDIQPMHM